MKFSIKRAFLNDPDMMGWHLFVRIPLARIVIGFTLSWSKVPA